MWCVTPNDRWEIHQKGRVNILVHLASLEYECPDLMSISWACVIVSQLNSKLIFFHAFK